jgi:hypothetical protein
MERTSRSLVVEVSSSNSVYIVFLVFLLPAEGAAAVLELHLAHERLVQLLVVAVQVKCESKNFETGVCDFIGSRVETGRFQAMGQLDSSCTGPPPRLVDAVAAVHARHPGRRRAGPR